jgi:hypothetical protein
MRGVGVRVGRDIFCAMLGFCVTQRDVVLGVPVESCIKFRRNYTLDRPFWRGSTYYQLLIRLER